MNRIPGDGINYELLGLYMLDENRVPYLVTDIMKWAEWMCVEENRRVASTTIDNVWVSTVFIGDRLMGMFETMVFNEGDRDSKYDDDQYRCNTWEEAEKIHDIVVRSLTCERRVN